MAHRLQSPLLHGPAGKLEALLEEPPDLDRLRGAAVLCHPHPQYGGTMHNKVMYRLARGARRAGSVVLRFNYRGVGASTGVYDGGRGEQDDLRAALRYMKDRYPGLPLTAGGFSFGSRLALRVGCSDPEVSRIVPVGLPVDRGDFGFLAKCVCPKHFIHSTQDEYGSRASMERVYGAAAGPKALTWVEAQDHFFRNALGDLEAAACRAMA